MRFKKIISMGVLAAILLQGLVALIVWQVQIHLLHKQNWNNEISEFAFEMKLTHEEFQKAKVNSHEIQIERKMYDIKSADYTSTGVTLMVISDEHESYLHEKIIKHFAEGSPKTLANEGIQLPILFTLSYFQTHQDFIFHNAGILTQLVFTNLCIDTYDHSTIHTPPPDFRLIS